MNKRTYTSSEIPDINDIKTTGVYFIKKYMNGPSKIAGTDNIVTHHSMLFVMGSPEIGTWTQILIPDDLDIIYKRYSSNNWKTITFT